MVENKEGFGPFLHLELGQTSTSWTQHQAAARSS